MIQHCFVRGVGVEAFLQQAFRGVNQASHNSHLRLNVVTEELGLLFHVVRRARKDGFELVVFCLDGSVRLCTISGKRGAIFVKGEILSTCWENASFDHVYHCLRLDRKSVLYASYMISAR